MREPVDTFVFYRSWYESLKELPAEQFKRIIANTCEYALDGTEPVQAAGAEGIAFLLMKHQIDAAKKNYAETCERNRQAALKRWQKEHTNECERIQAHGVDASANE